MIEHKVSGSATLDEIRLTCGTVENGEFCKLTSLNKLPVENGKHMNLAQFTEVDPADDVPPDLVLAEVPEGTTDASVIAAQLANGKHPIWDVSTAVFVEDNE